MILKNYFSDLFFSITNISFYQKLAKRKFSRVLIFFIISFILLGAWFSSEIISRDLPQLQTEFEQSWLSAKTSYPDSFAAGSDNIPDIKNILPLVLIPMYLLFVFFSTLIDSLIIYLFLSIFRKFNFKYLLKISLHVAVIAGIVDRISSLIYAKQYYPLFSLSYWLIMILVISSLPKQTSWHLNPPEEKGSH